MYSVSVTPPDDGELDSSRANNGSEEQKQLTLSRADVTDEDTANKLAALLEPVSPARGDIDSAGEPDYAVSLPDGSTVLIYLDGQAVYADFGDGEVLTVGSADDVRALLDKDK